MGNSESSAACRSTDSAYILDNAGKGAPERFAALSDAFDLGTMRHLKDRGIAQGWRCLEVGGGGGSIATWLAARVGPSGRVIVTDIDPRYLESWKLPNLEVWRHDIVDDSLPKASFDLIHARLVLMHLPERERVLARLVTALKPGGWLVDEEFDSCVVPDRTLSSEETFTKTHDAMLRIMHDRGVEIGFGRRLFGLLRAAGLSDVGAEGRTSMWPSGSPGPTLMRSNYEQLRSAMIEGGYITEEEFAHDLEGLNAPNFLIPSPLLWATWGRRS
jgi:SAM-dependent methyltransferase